MATENAQRVGGFDSKSARQQRQNWAYFPHRAGLALHAGLGVGCDLSTCGTTKALGIPVSGILKLSLPFSLLISFELDCFLRFVVPTELSIIKFFLWRSSMNYA